MNETRKRLHDGAAYSSNGEDETDIHLLRVREVLTSLPKECCPAGFEFRLNRRLQGGGATSPDTARGLMSGWFGVGLGFAVAAVIALFMFDFTGTQNTITGTAATVEKIVPAGTETKAEPGTSASLEQDKLIAGTADSAKRTENPTYVSPDRLQQVSGGSNTSVPK